MPQPIPGFPMPFAPSSHAYPAVQEPFKRPVTEEQPLPPGVDPVDAKGVADVKSRTAVGEAGGEKSGTAVSSGESVSIGGESAVGKQKGEENKSEVPRQEQQQSQ